MKEKNIQLERTVFFCDAVVAIAITLLALDLRIDHVEGPHLTFFDILEPWHNFLAFLLSFINIAGFWKTHQSFFTHIKKMDENLLWINIFWLFFIVMLPFSTTLVSAYFFDTPAIFVYSLNTLLITIMQNIIWDYSSVKREYIADTIDPVTASRLRIYVNLDMVNALLAVALSFVNPVVAFILLFTKLPMIIIAVFIFGKDARREHDQANNKTGQ